uniref:Queuine tRNA-ribosyltransferase accessory subunit 2 n=1 Tax=Eubosmina coregoni TaxID=186181 RepID=A0A4Y7LMP7_9CRUS|nr:EOG090X08JG [Eubosmina coregoni]SVE69881.1 EOG090X08JG [Eubosmina coregoni]
MKFTINSVAKSGGRIGLLSDLLRLPEASFETPFLLLHTRGGSVPHLSYDLLQMVTNNEQHILQMPVVSLIDCTQNVKAFGKGIAEFAGLQEYLNYATLQDSGISTPQGYHEKNSVSIWTRHGRKLIDPQTYINCMESLKPDMFQAVADADTSTDSTMKRVKRSVDDTIKFHSICANLKEKSEVLNQTPMLACVMGGYNVKERLRCIEELKAFDCSGYVIDGFHSNGVSAAKLNWEEVEPVLTETLSALPEQRPRVFHGAVTPLLLLKLASRGIDIFDATFPWLVGERGGALIFPNSLSLTAEPVTETLPIVKNVAAYAAELKTGKQADKDQDEEETFSNCYEIDLKDKVYFNDPGPLLSNCCCYSCRKYSRSYIHHLLSTTELLGPMLLMMHNLHHYLIFLRNIRSSIKEDRLDEFQDKLNNFVTSRLNKN